MKKRKKVRGRQITKLDSQDKHHEFWGQGDTHKPMDWEAIRADGGVEAMLAKNEKEKRQTAKKNRRKARKTSKKRQQKPVRATTKPQLTSAELAELRLVRRALERQ